MTEDKILLSHARDLKNRCADYSLITATQFLDLRQKALLLQIEKEQREYVKTYYYGGFENAERVCCVFVPTFYETGDINSFFSENEDESPISVLRVEKDKFSTLSHRDYLGALMGLGLKREMLGDILTDENGAYIFCQKNMQQFILTHLEFVARARVEVSKASLSSLMQRNENFEEIFACVASERLDNMVSAAFSLSRAKSAEFIEKGVVFVNSVQILKPDKKVEIGDKIVFRSKGKVIYQEQKGQSKKGRIHILFKKYI